MEDFTEGGWVGSAEWGELWEEREIEPVLLFMVRVGFLGHLFAVVGSDGHDQIMIDQ